VPSATAFRQGHDVEQLRGKLATEALKEAQKQATAAAQSIAVAREAAMELDKVVLFSCFKIIKGFSVLHTKRKVRN